MKFQGPHISILQPFETFFKCWVVLLILGIYPHGALSQDKLRIEEIKTDIQTTTSDTAKIKLYLMLSEQYDTSSRVEIDSALQYLNEAVRLSEKHHYKNYLNPIYKRFSAIFTRSGNYSFSLEYLLKTLKLLDEESSEKRNDSQIIGQYAGIYSDIGLCYFNMDNNKSALDYFQKSLEEISKAASLDDGYPTIEKQIKLYANIGSAYLNNYQFQEAEPNFIKALQLNKSLKNLQYDGSLYNNLGIVYKEKKDFTKAFEYYYQSLAIRKLLKDSAQIAQTYNNLGDAFFLTGQTDSAIFFLNKANDLSILTGNLRSQMKAANFLSLAYEKSGNFSKALDFQKTFKNLHDSIISNENVQNSIRLELQYHYEKLQRENELKTEVTLAQKDRKTLIYMILCVLLLSTLIVLFLANRNQRMKLQQSKLQSQRIELERKNLALEKNNLEMKNNNLELELEFRNKELSTHVMYLLNKNEFISSIISKLIKIKSDSAGDENNWIQEILREMQSNVDHTVWTEFELRFQQVHQDFYKKLLEHYPDLTPNEIKICAFLKLNMSTKDISAITFQSIKSIQVARNRLRKKMGIDREENLVSTIQQF